MSPAGEALLLHARKILASTHDLLAAVAAVSTEVNATLSISAVESLSAYVLPGPLAAMRERWPNVRFEVTTGPCTEIRAKVAGGRSDVGFVIEADTGLRDDAVLATVRLLVVATRGHLWAGQELGPSELRKSDFHMSDAAGDYHDVLRRFFEGWPAPRTQSLGTVEGVKRSLLAGDKALGVLPAHAVERELREGALVEVKPRPSLGGLVVRGVRSPRVADSPVVADLIGCLRAAF